MEDPQKPMSPIYLSVKRLDKVLSLINARSMTSVNPDYFLSFSFSSSDANLAIASLRFLGLIDNNSNSTPLMTKMGYKGEAKTEALIEIIKTAYCELFKMAPEAHNMDKDELHNDFMHTYKISSRVASSAVPAFIYLCEQAGLRKTQTQSKTKEISDSKNKKDVRKNDSFRKTSITTMTDSDYTIIPFGENGIKLIIPVDVLTNVNLFEDYKKLISSVTTFSNEYSKSKNQNKDEGQIPTEE